MPELGRQSSAGTCTIRQPRKTHLLQIGHAHDIQFGWKRKRQREPVAFAPLAESCQGVAERASANAQAAIRDKDNLKKATRKTHVKFRVLPQIFSHPAEP